VLGYHGNVLPIASFSKYQCDIEANDASSGGDKLAIVYKWKICRGVKYPTITMLSLGAIS